MVVVLSLLLRRLLLLLWWWWFAVIVGASVWVVLVEIVECQGLAAACSLVCATEWLHCHRGQSNATPALLSYHTSTFQRFCEQVSDRVVAPATAL